LQEKIDWSRTKWVQRTQIALKQGCGTGTIFLVLFVKMLCACRCR